MGSLVAVGGIHVPGSTVRSLESELEALCVESGFPPDEEFKWSPERARGAGVTATVVVEDKGRRPAIPSSRTAEEDVVTLALERADNHLRNIGTTAIVVMDRPGGSRKHEDRFLANCMDKLKNGTQFVAMERLALVLTTDSKHLRLLQLADVVVASTLARVAGEDVPRSCSSARIASLAVSG
jgi:hypothetical protein